MSSLAGSVSLFGMISMCIATVVIGGILVGTLILIWKKVFS